MSLSTTARRSGVTDARSSTARSQASGHDCGRARARASRAPWVMAGDSIRIEDRWRDAGQCRRHAIDRSEEHTSELQSHSDLVCRLLLEKKKKKRSNETKTEKQYAMWNCII